MSVCNDTCLVKFNTSLLTVNVWISLPYISVQGTFCHEIYTVESDALIWIFCGVSIKVGSTKKKIILKLISK